MATLIPVPVTLPDSKVPTKRMVRDIVGTFLREEWLSTEPESLNISYRTNFTNPNCCVERLAPTSGTPAKEPLKLFIKFHNDTSADIESFKHLTPTKQEEALLCHEYGLSGLGAKVYGFFKTQDGTLGRIDEFLDARTLEPEDVEDEVIRADVARGLAVFHTMKISMTKKPVELFYEALINGLQKYHMMKKMKILGRDGGVNIDDLIDYNFGPRVRKVVSKLNLLNGKSGWCIHDVQFMNVLVKNNPRYAESKIVLIDFEFVMQNYRAFDIGGHFMQKMFKWFDRENKIANCRKYTDQEKRHFCTEYVRTWNEVTGDSDTVEQVFMESEYGYMLAIAFDIHNMLSYMDSIDDRDPLNLYGLRKLFDEFVDQYAKLDLEDPCESIEL